MNKLRDISEKNVSSAQSLRRKQSPKYHLTHATGAATTAGTLATQQDDVPRSPEKKLFTPGSSKNPFAWERKLSLGQAVAQVKNVREIRQMPTQPLMES